MPQKTSPKKKDTGRKKKKTASPAAKKKERRTAQKASSQKRETKKAQAVDSKEAPDEGFHIVGVGASAGGLEAFEMFFKNVSSQSGMAFVLVTHLERNNVSLLPEIMQRTTDIKVEEIKDGMEVQPDHIYVIPPDRNLGILRGKLQLMEMETTTPRAPINYFFRALAEDIGDRAIGIILSGTGSDGTEGLKAIKAELGMTMVQAPEEARFDGMPCSAIDAGLADYIVPANKMPEQLTIYRKHQSRAAQKVDNEWTEQLQKIFFLLRRVTGHDFSSYKRNTILRRIGRRIIVHQIDDVKQYVRYLQESKKEVGLLFKELLIGVTNFFRDPGGFKVLEQKVVPMLLQDKPDDYQVRIWCPGVATGEEAYSIAIIFQEYIDKFQKNFKVQIFATDINEAAIEKARTGVYSGNIAKDVSSERLRKFFEQEDHSYRIRSEIREQLVFAQQNVIKEPPFTKLDLICCRNLLIYLDTDLQQKLLPMFHYSLKPNGVLFLGSSENIGEFTDLFAIVDNKWKVFRRKETAGLTHRNFDLPLLQVSEKKAQTAQKKTDSISAVASAALLANFAPPSVIVDSTGDILFIHGRTGKYLEPSTGAVDRMNINEMARQGLKMTLTSAIRKVRSQGTEVTMHGLKIKTNGGQERVDVTVKPLPEAGALDGYIMITFQDVRPAKTEKESQSKEVVEAERTAETLEKELGDTRENLQTTIEELETSNEELKSMNEEYQSTNEELKSANEELETSREEMQSLNEELATVNDELQNKVDHLAKMHYDMRHYLDSLKIPAIYLDNALSIKLFTTAVKNMANLIDSDTGRPLEDITLNLKYDGLIADAQNVLQTKEGLEKEVQSKDGRWHIMRIIPYYDRKDTLDGVVVSFTDIHDLKQTGQKLESSETARAYAESIVQTVREPLLVLDNSLRVISANRAFHRKFRTRPKDVEGVIIYKLGNKQWDIPRLHQLLDKVTTDDEAFEDFEMEHEFPEIGYRKFMLNARRLQSKKPDERRILLAMEDVTE